MSPVLATVLLDPPTALNFVVAICFQLIRNPRAA